MLFHLLLFCAPLPALVAFSQFLIVAVFGAVAVEIFDLSFAFKNKKVVDQLDLELAVVGNDEYTAWKIE